MTPIPLGRLQRARLKEMFRQLFPSKTIMFSLQKQTNAVIDNMDGEPSVTIAWFELLFTHISTELGHRMNVLPIIFYELWAESPDKNPIDIVYEKFEKLKNYGTCAKVY